LTLLAKSGQFCAVAATVFRRKVGAFRKLNQTGTGPATDLGDTTQPEGQGVGSKDAAQSISSPLACKDASMASTNLRIYRGPIEETSAPRSTNPARETVTVNLGEVLPLLADAVASRRTWLSDFEDDEITISADLYEVLLAYQYYRHPAA
jgi:hypothetical protein